MVVHHVGREVGQGPGGSRGVQDLRQRLAETPARGLVVGRDEAGRRSVPSGADQGDAMAAVQQPGDEVGADVLDASVAVRRDGEPGGATIATLSAFCGPRPGMLPALWLLTACPPGVPGRRR